MDNIQDSSVKAPTGTSRAAAIRRLRKEAPTVGKPGAPAGNVNAAKDKAINVDNVNVDSVERPTGNSRAAAIRRLRKSAPTVGKNGGDRKSKDRNQFDGGKTDWAKGGNSLTYQAGRLKRDRPELAQDKITAYL